MKKILSVASLCLSTCFSLTAQKISADKVPTAVTTAFEKAYPATPVKWEKENEKFEAGFKQNNHSISILYAVDGTMLESETDIKQSELPQQVLVYIKQNYTGKQVKETAKITKADGTINYEAEVDGKDLIFDVIGNFIKSVKD